MARPLTNWPDHADGHTSDRMNRPGQTGVDGLTKRVPCQPRSSETWQCRLHSASLTTRKTCAQKSLTWVVRYETMGRPEEHISERVVHVGQCDQRCDTGNLPITQRIRPPRNLHVRYVRLHNHVSRCSGGICNYTNLHVGRTPTCRTFPYM